MAERRLFTKKITDSDAFLEMPTSAQCLYFHLNMNADDDGFVNNPKKIQRSINACDDDLRILIAKAFIIAFETGVIVIKHWWMHNILRKDRYHETEYVDEKSMLYIKENGTYTLDETQGNPLMATKWQPNGNQMVPQVKLSKEKLSKVNIYDIDELVNETNSPNDNIKSVKHKYGKYNNVLLTDDEYKKLQNDYTNANNAIEFLSEYREMKGYKAKSDYLAIKKWVFDAIKENQQRKDRINGTHVRDFEERTYSEKETASVVSSIDETDLENL